MTEPDKITRTAARVPLVTREREGVRALALGTCLLLLVAMLVALGFGSLLVAAGALVGLIGCGLFAVSLYNQLHQEELARITRARATQAMRDPFEQE